MFGIERFYNWNYSGSEVSFLIFVFVIIATILVLKYVDLHICVIVCKFVDVLIRV